MCLLEQSLFCVSRRQQKPIQIGQPEGPNRSSKQLKLADQQELQTVVWRNREMDTIRELTCSSCSSRSARDCLRLPKGHTLTLQRVFAFEFLLFSLQFLLCSFQSRNFEELRTSSLRKQVLVASSQPVFHSQSLAASLSLGRAGRPNGARRLGPPTSGAKWHCAARSVASSAKLSLETVRRASCLTGGQQRPAEDEQRRAEDEQKRPGASVFCLSKMVAFVALLAQFWPETVVGAKMGPSEPCG